MTVAAKRELLLCGIAIVVTAALVHSAAPPPPVIPAVSTCLRLALVSSASDSLEWCAVMVRRRGDTVEVVNGGAPLVLIVR